MGFLDALKNGVRKLDFFRTAEYFRYKSQPQYKSLFGGIVSLLLIISLLATFSNKLFDTIDKVVITSDSIHVNAADPTPFNISTFPEDQFMFGVEIWHHDLNTGKRYFDVILRNVQFDTGEPRDSSPIYPLQQCTLDHWSGFPDVQKDYQRLKMNYWLCLPRNMKYNIQGKYASVFSQTLEVAVNKCTNESDPSRPCASQTQIDDFFLEKGPFFFTIYFINPLINPTSEEYLTHYLEDNNYIIFTDKFGSEGVLFTQEYQITTDESIWPFSDNRQDSGGIVTQFALKNPYEIQGDVYCFFSFFKSGKNQIIKRNFQKIDQVLSYMGGLFGTITICLFFVRIYNQSALEIQLGASLFQLKNESQEKILKNYNFFRFLSTGVYKILGFIGCIPDWKSCKEYDESNEEMAKQLDVLYLLKRVIFLQRAINSLLNEHQLKGIHFHEKLTLEEAKRHRKNFKAKKKLIHLNEKAKKSQGINSPITTLSQQQNSSYERGGNSHQVYNLCDNIVQQQTNVGVSHYRMDKRTKLKTIFMKKKSIFEDDSSSVDSEHSDSQQILNELQQLKKEAKKGDPVSRKIWLRFNSQVRDDISRILKDQQDKESEKEVEEQPQSSQTQIYKFLPSLPLPTKTKFNKRKVNDQPRNQGHLQISNRTQNSGPKIKFQYTLNDGNEQESREQPKQSKKHTRIFNNN